MKTKDNGELGQELGTASILKSLNYGLSKVKPKNRPLGSEFADFIGDTGGGFQEDFGNALDIGSGVASMIPGVGTAIATGMQVIKGISDLTSADQDEYGIHKSDLMSWLNPQTERRADKMRFENKKITDTIVENDEIGAKTRATIGGFKSAPYGKKGRKLKTRFSR